MALIADIERSSVSSDALKSTRSRSSKGDSNYDLDALFEIAFGQSAEPQRDLVDGADPGRDVGHVIDDFHHATIEIENRIVGNRDPNFPTPLNVAPEFLVDTFAAIQSAPELLVFGGLTIRLVHENAMCWPWMFLAADSQIILRKFSFAVEDRAIGGIFGNGPRLGNGVEFAGVLGGQQFGRGDVEDELDHLEHGLRLADDRIV